MSSVSSSSLLSIKSGCNLKLTVYITQIVFGNLIIKLGSVQDIVKPSSHIDIAADIEVYSASVSQCYK